MYFLLLETGIDTPFSLYFQYNLPLAFGQVAKGILSNLVKVKKKNVIHFVLDKWISFSIKDNQSNELLTANIRFQITRPP